MTEFNRVLEDITRDLRQIYKRLDEVELSGVQFTGGVLPPAGTVYNHLEDNGAAWASVTNMTLSDGASIRSPAGPVVTFDDTGDDLEITNCDVFIDPTSTLIAPDGTLHVYTASAGAVTAWASANDGVFESSGDGGISILTPDANIGTLAFGGPASNQRGYISYDHSTDSMSFAVFASPDFIMRNGSWEAQAGSIIDLNGNADALVLDADADTSISAPTDDQIDIEIAGADDFTFTANSFNVLAGSSIYQSEYRYHLGDADTNDRFQDDRWTLACGGVTMIDAVEAATDYLVLLNGLNFIGDTSNANMTVGLTINQGTNDDEILACKSSDVAHGMTDLAETDTWLTIDKSAAPAGGGRIIGYRDADATAIAALNLRGRLGENATTTKTSSDFGIVNITGEIKSGAGVGAVNAGGNILSIRDNANTIAIFAQDGDMYLDTVVNENHWDEHDDLALLHGLRASLVPDGHELQKRFGAWINYARPILERTGVITYNDDGHHFVATKKLQMLTIDALRQVAVLAFNRINVLEQKIGVLENGTQQSRGGIYSTIAVKHAPSSN